MQSAAVSVSGDDDPINFASSSAGSGEVDLGAEGANTDVPIPMDEGPSFGPADARWNCLKAMGGGERWASFG